MAFLNGEAIFVPKLFVYSNLGFCIVCVLENFFLLSKN